MNLAQLLSAQRENPFKVKAWRRAARLIRTLRESLDDKVRANADLTGYPGIGKGIASAIREIVLSGESSQLAALRTQVSPEVVAISEYPRLDPARVLRIYKKLKLSSIVELRAALASGAIATGLGTGMAEHVRQALTETHQILLYEADVIVEAVRSFLLTCGASRVEVTGDCRRRVELIGEISFLIETADFASVIARLQRYGGETEVLASGKDFATFPLSQGITLRIEKGTVKNWGLSLLRSTGSEGHLAKLPGIQRLTTGADESSVYRKLGLEFIPPELREGLDEADLAAAGELPPLVEVKDIRGELHAHSTSSDGASTVAQMAAAAAARGYRYLGITDHSQSLKIARGLSPKDLRNQLRAIDKLNETSSIRILKSAEVDILTDGSLDYPDDLLRELDYTICSIHSKFSLGRTEQTERILRAMDNRWFNILGHATGRRLLNRPGYEIDLPRILEHASQNGCFLEINSSPNRLDLSAAHARLARDARVKIAITTDAHSTREYDWIRYGVDQARRAGIAKSAILNTRSWEKLRVLIKRS